MINRDRISNLLLLLPFNYQALLSQDCRKRFIWYSEPLTPTHAVSSITYSEEGQKEPCRESISNEQPTPLPVPAEDHLLGSHRPDDATASVLQIIQIGPEIHEEDILPERLLPVLMRDDRP